jgi:hypothetical protein
MSDRQQESMTVPSGASPDEGATGSPDEPRFDGQGQAVREDGPATSGFDPTPYIRQLRGRGGGEYLDVKWRLLWLRKDHPDAEIVTELVEHDGQMAIFKATVTVPSGGKATGYGSETASDFPDFIEKAETKAIGRALNALGYGAQFGEAARPDDSSPARFGDRPSGPSVAPARPVPLPRSTDRTVSRAEPVREQPGDRENRIATAEGEPELAEYSWSAFWPWARDRGLNGPKEIEILIGQQVAGLSPLELRELILAADPRP